MTAHANQDTPPKAGRESSRSQAPVVAGGEGGESASPSQSGKHTPGPWRYSQAKNNRWYAFGADNRPIVVPNVAATNRHLEEMEANFCLIAAAPELFEALKNMLALYQSGTSDPQQSPGQFCREAEAAIAKAEGRSA